jgi:hypothetical protein
LASTTPCQERAERGAEPHQRHQERDADHQHQRRGGEKLPQVGRRDEPEERLGQPAAHPDHQRDRPEIDERGLPAGQAVDEAQGGPVLVYAMGRIRRAMGDLRQFRQRQQRQKRQHRDHRDVLRKKHGERPLPAIGAHQPLLVQRLQDDRGGGKRKDETHGERDAPPQSEDHADRHHRCRRQADLPAAETQEAPPHLPKLLGLQFQADEEQHHHHAELGEMLDGDHVNVEEGEDRADHDPRDQVAQHRSKAEARGDGHRDHARDEKHEGEEEEVGHGAGPCGRRRQGTTFVRKKQTGSPVAQRRGRPRARAASSFRKHAGEREGLAPRSPDPRVRRGSSFIAPAPPVAGAGVRGRARP